MPRAGRQTWVNADVYEDTGCPDLQIPSCLSCPLPRCRFEYPAKVAAALVQQMLLLPLLAAGQTVSEAGATLGKSRRTVYRLIADMQRRGITVPGHPVRGQ